MRRTVLKILAAAVLLAAAFTVCFLAGAKARVTPASADELAWLRDEFRLSDAEFARIRQLHDGYLPLCDEMCRRIGAANRELSELLAASSNVTAAVTQKLGEVCALRAECQGRMLRYFFEVSHAMPPAQGARYLAEMKRQTLGLHAQQEAAMTRPNPPAHDAR
jgi:hypothetical protein